MATQNNVRVQNITQECNQKELDDLKAFDKLLLRQDVNVSGTEVAINEILADNKVTTLEGLLSDGSKYKMKIPSNYNGIVFLYSHGYRFKFDVPKPIDPNGYVVNNEPDFNPATSATRKDDRAASYIFENFLLKRGVALIGSGFPVQGWNAIKGIESNKLLLDLFKSKYPQTKKVVVHGSSLGSHIAQGFAEKYPDLVDAVGLYSYVGQVIEVLHTAGDVVWFLKTFFDGTLKCVNYKQNQAPEIEALEEIVKVKQILVTLSKPENLSKWSEDLTNLPPAGKQLKAAGVPPLLVILLMNYLTDLPDKSAHYDGVSLSIVVNKNYIHKTFTTIENIVEAAVLAVAAMQDVEAQCGGVIYDNSKVNFASRLSNTDREYFDFIKTDFNLDRDTVLNSILGVLASPLAPRITANPEARLKCSTPNVPGSINIVQNIVRKPTIVVCGKYDNVTPVFGLKKLYNDVKKDPLASNKLLTLVVEASEKYTLFDGQTLPRSDVPAAQGTAHVNFSNNEWLSYLTLLLYSVENNKKLEGDKLNNLLTTLPNNVLCNDEFINTLPSSFYTKEL